MEQTVWTANAAKRYFKQFSIRTKLNMKMFLYVYLFFLKSEIWDKLDFTVPSKAPTRRSTACFHISANTARLVFWRQSEVK